MDWLIEKDGHIVAIGASYFEIHSIICQGGMYGKHLARIRRSL